MLRIFTFYFLIFSINYYDFRDVTNQYDDLRIKSESLLKLHNRIVESESTVSAPKFMS